MFFQESLRGFAAGAALACSVAGFSGEASAQSSGNNANMDGNFAEAAKGLGVGFKDFFAVCIGKQKICSKDGKGVSFYTGDFSSVRLGKTGGKIPHYGNILLIPGNFTPEPKGVFKLLIGSKFTDVILSHVPRMNGDVLIGSTLPGKLGKSVTEAYGGRINVDGGVQLLARAQIGGALGEVLKFFGFPTGKVLLRAGAEIPKGPGGLVAGGGRSGAEGKKIPNGFVEFRVPGKWKNPFLWSNTTLEETLVFADQEGIIRMEGILTFNDDKRRPKRQFMVLVEMPATTGKSGAGLVWSLRRMKIGFASSAVSMKDVFKLTAAMASAGAGAASPFNPIFKLKNPLNELANLMPELVEIKNPKWDNSKAQVNAAPFPTAKYFNILFLSYLASHKVEITKSFCKKNCPSEDSEPDPNMSDEEPQIGTKTELHTVNGPHLQILGNLNLFGVKWMDFGGIDFAVGPNVKNGIRLNAHLGNDK